MNKKFILIASGITILVMILVLLLSPKKNLSTSTLIDNSTSALDTTKPINLSDDKQNKAMIYLDSVEKKLPIYLESFDTSVGIITSINISRTNRDQAGVIYLNINGLSYLSSETNPSINPNITAFKESYLKAIELLEGQNIDPKKLIFIYGDKDYVRKTSQIWIDALKLRP